MMYVIGARGRFGHAACASVWPDGVAALDRDVYENWWRADAAAAIRGHFESAPAGSTVLVAAGVLDPALPEAQHQRVNVELPVRVIQGACAAGLRVVTLGTVMERLVESPNAYIAAKARLGRFVALRADAGDPVLHVQIHTLYGGGDPQPFMFLGQLCSALREERPFEMSPGRQLREYHHVDDDVAALRTLIGVGATGVLALSHGAPTTLRELACHVFRSVGREDLLRIGARPEPPDDNYATVLARPEALSGVDFRPSLPGVAAYVRSVVSTPHCIQ